MARKTKGKDPAQYKPLRAFFSYMRSAKEVGRGKKKKKKIILFYLLGGVKKFTAKEKNWGILKDEEPRSKAGEGKRDSMSMREERHLRNKGLTSSLQQACE